MHLRDSELSVTLLEEMEASGMPANAEGYATAIRTCARCGDIHKATALYARSLKLAIVPTSVRLQCSSCPVLAVLMGIKSVVMSFVCWVLCVVAAIYLA